MSRTIRGGDLFAGAGGFSEGLKRAAESRGLDLESFAINHWDRAIATHTLNHPYAEHRCEDVQVVRPRELVPSGHLHLLLAAPSCVHHSNARGGKPVNEQDRASAWCVTRWLTEIEVDTLVLENVPEFKSWGPVDPETKRPVKAQRGRYFNAFVNTLRELGYSVEYKVLCCADYGDPTTRKRLFLVATKKGRVAWPEATHCDPRVLAKDSFGLFSDRHPWVPARKIIDWSIKSQSVFLRKKRLATKTLERTYAGFKKYGGPNAAPFLFALRHYIDGGDFSRPFLVQEDGTTIVAPDPVMVTFRNHAEGGNMDDPLPAVCAGGLHHGVAEPVVVNMKGQSDATPSDQPIPTQTAHAPHLYVAEPERFLLAHEKFNHENVDPIDQPVRTIDATNGRHIKVVEPFLIPHEKFTLVKADSLDEPIRTLDASNANRHQVVEPFIIPHEKFGEDGTDSVDLPLRTLDAHNANETKVVEPIIVPSFGERDGQDPRCHSVDNPLPTVTATGHQQLVEGKLEPVIVDINHGTAKGDTEDRRAHSLDQPLGTLTTQPGKAVAKPSCIALATAEATEGWKPGLPTFVTPDGRWFQIDVHLRMLRPHELGAAHSVPEYTFLGTLEEQVKQIGNMVPAGIAEALCGAQLDQLFDRLEDPEAVAV